MKRAINGPLPGQLGNEQLADARCDSASKSVVRRHSVAGFTLLELTLSMAITVVVMTLVFRGMTMMSQSTTHILAQTMVQDEAKRLNEYIAEVIRNCGGGWVRPWTGIIVENDVNIFHSDRITVAKLKDDEMQCQLLGFDGTVMVFPMGPSTACCISDEFLGQQLIVLSNSEDNHEHWGSYVVSHVFEDICALHVLPGRIAVANQLPGSNLPWINGVIGAVNIQQLQVNHDEHTLLVEEDFDDDGSLEARVVADRVFDLQAAMGYDVAPWDWLIHDANDTSDEWLFNSELDGFGVPNQGLTDARRSDLRMIKFSVVVGYPVRSFSHSQTYQLLDSPTHTLDSWILGNFISTVGLRNYEIMR